MLFFFKEPLNVLCDHCVFARGACRDAQGGHVFEVPYRDGFGQKALVELLCVRCAQNDEVRNALYRLELFREALPTSGTARFFSPLSVDDFIKKSSFIYYTEAELLKAADDIIRIAETEELTAHANSIAVRKKK